MKHTEIYDAAQFARSMTKSLDVALAFADEGLDAKADYRLAIALSAFTSLADHLGYRVEKITADPARTLAYLDAGRPATADHARKEAREAAHG
jgi:hypothetical protein